MKKLLLTIIALLITLPCFAFEWEEFYADPQEEKIAYVDVESLVAEINNKKPIKKVWGKIKRNKEKFSLHMLNEIDCQKQRTRVLVIKSYDIDEKQLLKTLEQPAEWTKIQKETMPDWICHLDKNF